MANFGESGDQSAKRSTSRPRTPRPTTPLRPSSRSSFRDSARARTEHDAPFPLNTFEPAFAELADSMADLEANLMHLQLMHESLARFGESFAGFLYGLNMNAFCVDFPEGPIPESFRHARAEETSSGSKPQDTRGADDPENEATFMTTDTSFIENPVSQKQPPKFTTPDPKTSHGCSTGQPLARGSRGGRAERGSGQGRERPSGLIRPRVRGVR
ncbi:hypothetical protein VUR80DRAFT_6096 [Thermomyces stellatus]